MKKLILTFISGVLLMQPLRAQNDESAHVLTLKDVIRIAREQSIAAKSAETNLENRYWQYQTFRSDYKPQLGLNGTFPAFTRAFDEVRQPDGTYDYLPVILNNSQLSLSLSQSIAQTGTTLFLNTDVSRFDNFVQDDTYHIYGGTPIEIGFIQPLFQFNSLRWNKKIEPLRYEESKREFLQNLEEVSIMATRRFFSLMLAQIDLAIAEKNLANNDTLYQIAQGRYTLGKIAENDLLQLKLSLMNSRQAVSQAKLDLETSRLRLKTYIGISGSKDIRLILPDEIPDFSVNEGKAIEEAFTNRSESVQFERRKNQAKMSIAQAKGAAGPNANLFGQFGLTNRTAENAPIGDIYKDPESQLIVNLGFQIPILDWGRRKARVKTAEANAKLVDYTVSQDELNFREQILTLVRQFQMLKDKIKITRLANEVGQKRYDVAKNRYLIGKTSITDLNIALQEKDEATAKYIQALNDYWTAYYNLRALTLYDFETDSKIISGEL